MPDVNQPTVSQYLKKNIYINISAKYYQKKGKLHHYQNNVKGTNKHSALTHSPHNVFVVQLFEQTNLTKCRAWHALSIISPQNTVHLQQLLQLA